MLSKQELWLVEELALEEAADPLTIPEIKQVGHDVHDDELGFRSLLELPEEVLGPWLGDDRPRARRAARKTRRWHHALRAA